MMCITIQKYRCFDFYRIKISIEKSDICNVHCNSHYIHIQWCTSKSIDISIRYRYRYCISSVYRYRYFGGKNSDFVHPQQFVSRLRPKLDLGRNYINLKVRQSLKPAGYELLYSESHFRNPAFLRGEKSTQSFD
ncbi:uncharacterized protein V6R79_004483 [Siganus canaliculatus]